MGLKSFIVESDNLLTEAFNSKPYETTMTKKGAGDVFFTFEDEDGKEYRIQFYTSGGLGKNVRRVYVGEKVGNVYKDAIKGFKNPLRVIATMIDSVEKYLMTPLGKTIQGLAVDLSKKAAPKGLPLIKKIMKRSQVIKKHLDLLDSDLTVDAGRGVVWTVRKGVNPADVYDGKKVHGMLGDTVPAPEKAPSASDFQKEVGDILLKKPFKEMTGIISGSYRDAFRLVVEKNGMVVASKDGVEVASFTPRGKTAKQFAGSITKDLEALADRFDAGEWDSGRRRWKQASVIDTNKVQDTFRTLSSAKDQLEKSAKGNLKPLNIRGNIVKKHFGDVFFEFTDGVNNFYIEKIADAYKAYDLSSGYKRAQYYADKAKTIEYGEPTASDDSSEPKATVSVGRDVRGSHTGVNVTVVDNGMWTDVKFGGNLATVTVDSGTVPAGEYVGALSIGRDVTGSNNKGVLKFKRSVMLGNTIEVVDSNGKRIIDASFDSKDDSQSDEEDFDITPYQDDQSYGILGVDDFKRKVNKILGLEEDNSINYSYNGVNVRSPSGVNRITAVGNSGMILSTHIFQNDDTVSMVADVIRDMVGDKSANSSELSAEEYEPEEKIGNFSDSLDDGNAIDADTVKSMASEEGWTFENQSTDGTYLMFRKDGNGLNIDLDGDWSYETSDGDNSADGEWGDIESLRNIFDMVKGSSSSVDVEAAYESEDYSTNVLEFGAPYTPKFKKTSRNILSGFKSDLITEGAKINITDNNLTMEVRVLADDNGLYFPSASWREYADTDGVSAPRILEAIIDGLVSKAAASGFNYVRNSRSLNRSGELTRGQTKLVYKSTIERGVDRNATWKLVLNLVKNDSIGSGFRDAVNNPQRGTIK